MFFQNLRKSLKKNALRNFRMGSNSHLDNVGIPQLRTKNYELRTLKLTTGQFELVNLLENRQGWLSPLDKSERKKQKLASRLSVDCEQQGR